MERVVVVILLAVGLVNAIPVVGVTSAAVLERLYGLGGLDGDLLILMRHRALLFGVLGGLIAASAFRRHWRGAAVAAGLVSMVGFVVLALLAGEYGASLRSVVVIDVIASAALIVAAVIHFRGGGESGRP